MFAKMKTGTKVLAGFAIALVVAIAVGLVGYRGISQLATQVDEIGGVRAPAVKSLLEVQVAAERIKTAQRTLINLNTDTTVRSRQMDNIKKARESYEACFKVYEALPQTSEEEAIWKQFQPAWQQWRTENNEFFKTMAELEAMKVGDFQALQFKIDGFLVDHYLLMTKLTSMVFDKDMFEGGEDLMKCGYSQWVATQKTENPEILSLIRQSERGHEQFHDAVKKAKQLAKEGNTAAAQKLFNDELLPAMKEIRSHLTAMQETTQKAQSLFTKANQQLMENCRISQDKSNELLDQLVKLNADMAEQSMHSAELQASRSTWAMVAAITVSIVVLLALGIFLAANISKAVSAVARYIDRIAKGDIPPTITENYTGDFNQIKNNLNQCIDAVNAMATDANMLSKSAVEGKLATRADATTHQGDFRKIIQGVNDTLDAVIGPLNMAADYVNQISKGKIPDIITANYSGDFNEIKTNLNQCVSVLTAMTQTGEIGQVLRRMGNKDFSQSIETTFPGAYGELSDNVNLVIANMRGAIEQISESAGQFAEGSRTIAESAQSLAQGAQTQSASVEEMTASTEELSRSVNAVKDNANESTKVATKSSQLAEEGGKAVQKSIESMEQIRTSSQKISEIIQVISEIASQTNLLALNAAIEAARAGEHGMGFAVVADEVRKLAERSNQAAREISSLIRESTQRVEEGAQLSTQTGEALKQIIKAAEETASKITEIAAATVQQAANTEEAAKAIQGVSQVTEQTAAGSEQMAASSEQLGAQASALRELVSQFRVGGSDTSHRLAGARK